MSLIGTRTNEHLSFPGRNRLAGQLDDDVARIKGRSPRVLDRPFEEVVLILDGDVTKSFADSGVDGHRDEAGVPVEGDVVDAGAHRLLALAFAADRAAAKPAERD